MKLGVICDCFKRPLAESIALAGKMGFSGVQIYAVGGEFSPDTLSDADIARYKQLLRDANLQVSALCGDLGGHGFEIAEQTPERIEKTKRIIDLAVKFDTKVVTTHIGVIPSEKNEKYRHMVAALSECGKYAAQNGVTLAIETGPEIAPVLAEFVKDAGEGVGVNLDPANFIMVTGQDPTEAVKLLAPYIVHTHLKDGKQLKPSDPVAVYGCFADGGIEALNIADFFIETPIGEGHVDFASYLAALRSIGFEGYLTVERETGADPCADIALAADYIRNNFPEYLK